MRNILILLIVLVLPIAAVSESDAKTLLNFVDDKSSGLMYTQVDLSQFDLKIVVATDYGMQGATVHQMMEKTGGLAGINGGFFYDGKKLAKNWFGQKWNAGVRFFHTAVTHQRVWTGIGLDDLHTALPNAILKTDAGLIQESDGFETCLGWNDSESVAGKVRTQWFITTGLGVERFKLKMVSRYNYRSHDQVLYAAGHRIDVSAGAIVAITTFPLEPAHGDADDDNSYVLLDKEKLSDLTPISQLAVGDSLNIHYEFESDTPGFERMTQIMNGRELLVKNKVARKGFSLYNCEQTAICFMKGKALQVVSPQTDFEKLALELEKLGCEQAISLDGGVSTGMSFLVDDKIESLLNTRVVSDALIVFPKKAREEVSFNTKILKDLHQFKLATVQDPGLLSRRHADGATLLHDAIEMGSQEIALYLVELYKSKPELNKHLSETKGSFGLAHDMVIERLLSCESTCALWLFLLDALLDAQPLTKENTDTVQGLLALGLKLNDEDFWARILQKVQFGPIVTAVKELKLSVYDMMQASGTWCEAATNDQLIDALPYRYYTLSNLRQLSRDDLAELVDEDLIATIERKHEFLVEILLQKNEDRLPKLSRGRLHEFVDASPAVSHLVKEKLLPKAINKHGQEVISLMSATDVVEGIINDNLLYLAVKKGLTKAVLSLLKEASGPWELDPFIEIAAKLKAYDILQAVFEIHQSRFGTFERLVVLNKVLDSTKTITDKTPLAKVIGILVAGLDKDGIRQMLLSSEVKDMDDSMFEMILSAFSKAALDEVLNARYFFGLTYALDPHKVKVLFKFWNSSKEKPEDLAELALMLPLRSEAEILHYLFDVLSLEMKTAVFVSSKSDRVITMILSRHIALLPTVFAGLSRQAIAKALMGEYPYLRQPEMLKRLASEERWREDGDQSEAIRFILRYVPASFVGESYAEASALTEILANPLATDDAIFMLWHATTDADRALNLSLGASTLVMNELMYLSGFKNDDDNRKEIDYLDRRLCTFESNLTKIRVAQLLEYSLKKEVLDSFRDSWDYRQKGLQKLKISKPEIYELLQSMLAKHDISL